MTYWMFCTGGAPGRGDMQLHKPQKQEFDNSFNAQETKEEEKKTCQGNRRVKDSFSILTFSSDIGKIHHP